MSNSSAFTHFGVLSLGFFDGFHFSVIFRSSVQVLLIINNIFFLPTGEASVITQFIVTENKKKVPVAGCKCIKGSLNKSKSFKVIRGDETIYEGNYSLNAN